MDIGSAPRLRTLIGAIASASVFAVSTVSIFYFYGLHGRATLYPYGTQTQQTIVILRVALIVALASSGPIWLSMQRERTIGSTARWSGLGVLIVLVVYGLAGCEASLERE